MAGEVFFFKALGERVGNHPRLMGFDTGNELLGHAPSTNPYELGEWSETLISTVRPFNAHKLHTISAQGIFIPPYPELLSTVGDVSVIHPWYFTNDAVVDGKLRDTPLHHVEYNIEYMRSFHPFSPQQPRRKVWVQEFGAPSVNFAGTTAIPPELAPEFATASYENALTCEDVFGITWWDSHDIDTTPYPGKFHAPEPTLGVYDTGGKLKPVGSAIAAVIARWHRGEIASPEPRTVAVTGTDSGISFQQLQEQGIRSAIVPLDLYADANYLARRGITRIAGTLT